VFPLSSDEQPWSLLDWCDQCHRKRGLVVWPDTPRLTAEHPAGEALLAAFQSQVDALEVVRESSLALYHALLQAGLRLTLVGSSGRDDRTHRLGQVRTYAQLRPEEECSLATFLEAVRAGRTVASSGPVVELRATDEAWEVEAESEQTVELLHNGRTIASAQGLLSVPRPNLAGGWIAARTHGPHGWAHTTARWLPGPFVPRLDSALTQALQTTAARSSDSRLRDQLNETLRRFS
jgi:hypothetical protein